MVEIHKPSRTRFVRARHSGDIVIDPIGPEAVSSEKIPIIGGWIDYTGSGGVSTKSQMFFAGLTNELDGTDASLHGAKKTQLGVLGERTETTRLRRKQVYIE